MVASIYFFNIYSFIYIWLQWILVAAHELSICKVSSCSAWAQLPCGRHGDLTSLTRDRTHAPCF